MKLIKIITTSILKLNLDLINKFLIGLKFSLDNVHDIDNKIDKFT